jgi:protein-disulfide isomerase
MCAGQQDRYWEMNEKLFATREDWAENADPSSVFAAYAEEVGLDAEALSQCLDAQDTAMVVQGDKMAAESISIDAMPYVLVNDLPVRGEVPIELLGQVIEYVTADGPTPAIVPSGEDWHVRGNRQTARAVTVAFVDYASPESGEHSREVLPQLVETYVDQGDLLYVFHPWSDQEGGLSAQAASAAECAGQQDKFWEMHDLLFEEQESWSQAADPEPLFTDYAQSLDLDTAEFETCLHSEWVTLRVQAGSVVGALYGVVEAPLFLFNNGEVQQGSPDFEEFQTVIDSILNQ